MYGFDAAANNKLRAKTASDPNQSLLSLDGACSAMAGPAFGGTAASFFFSFSSDIKRHQATSSDTKRHRQFGTCVLRPNTWLPRYLFASCVGLCDSSVGQCDCGTNRRRRKEGRCQCPPESTSARLTFMRKTGAPRAELAQAAAAAVEAPAVVVNTGVAVTAEEEGDEMACDIPKRLITFTQTPDHRALPMATTAVAAASAWGLKHRVGFH